MLRKALGDAADSDMAFAWKTLLFDTTSTDIFGLKEKRPGENLKFIAFFKRY